MDILQVVTDIISIIAAAISIVAARKAKSYRDQTEVKINQTKGGINSWGNGGHGIQINNK